ncbi:hypothetical protein [Nocardioides alcanivorans]|uniref:hypothetical protein n=1 Tax=Nocardioides alcanivorans TaxID=2897352 RepID=UPI001F18EA94|nr:hypothetical protein [Nocardioides alcanivorans]
MTKCQWVASDQPRELEDGSECPDLHCGSCGHRHVRPGVLTCPSCVGDVRDDLRTIADKAAELPEEAEVRGIDSEAADLAGPAADPEQWRQRGRYGHRWHEDAKVGEEHPLWVLGTWDMVVREHLSQPTTLRLTIDRAADYLAGQLTGLAQDGDFPFDVLRREVRACRGHLEDVLRDGEQRDTGAPCMTCRIPLVREWGILAHADGWRCPQCREFSTDAQYRFAVMQVHRAEAEWLTDVEMQERTGVKAATVRSWSRPIEDGEPLVAKRQDSGRVVYRVADVEYAAQAKGMMSA